MARVRVAVGLALGAAALTVLLFEFLLRAMGFSAPVWYQPDANLGWTLRPQMEAWFTAEGRARVHTNSAGLRNRELDVAKAAGIYRVAILGDSYSEAMQVDMDKAYWSVLEKQLTRCAYQPGKRVEVINFGVSGFGTGQQYLILQSKVLSYKPDLVLLQFTNGNDVMDNSKALDDEKLRPFFLPDAGGGLRIDDSFSRSRAFHERASKLKEWARTLTDHSRVVQLIRQVAKTARGPRGDGDEWFETGVKSAVFSPPRDASWEQAWMVTEQLIVAIQRSLVERGIRFAAFAVPHAIQVDPDRERRYAVEKRLGVADLLYPERRLKAFAERNDIEFIVLTEEMLGMAEKTKVHFHGFPNTRMGSGHWNELGHDAAGRILARKLCAASFASTRQMARQPS
jgi:hypothetical protein